MITKKHVAAVLFCAAALVARTDTVRAADCGVDKKNFDKLASIENDPSLGYAAAVKLELGIRKNILHMIVRCAVDEASGLKNRIDGASLAEPAAVAVRSKLGNELDNAVNYYRTQEAKIDDLGLQGSKDFSGNLEAWRMGNYELVKETGNNFLIWADDQAIFETAEGRMDQLTQTVTLLKFAYVEEVQNLWHDAENQFAEAKRLNKKSGDDLMTASPDEALATIKSSLDALSKTYEKLSDLITAINKQLAIPN